MMGAISFSQPPQKAIKYLGEKHPELHFDYDDIMHEAHHKAFTVAKITKLDLLTDVQNSITKALEEGQSFAQWKKEIKPTLKKKGWYGKTEVFNPKTGEFKEIYVGSRRLRHIFYTNARVAYAQGRCQHQAQLEDAPYLRYVSILDGGTRPTHKSMHGIILHRDNDFWKTNYAPNDHNCRCRVQAYSMDSIKRRGWEGKIRKSMPSIAHPDWAYNVCKDSKGKLEQIRATKILNAPKGLKSAAKEELALDELQKQTYAKVPLVLQTYLLTNRPKHKIDKDLEIQAGYQVSTQTIRHKDNTTSVSIVQHELGHHVDNINGDGLKLWSETNLTKLLKRDVSVWTNANKKEIATLLALKENENIALHDLFYMNSNRKMGEKTRDDKKEFTRSLVAKETFANIFEILLSSDNRIEILRLYFPLSLKSIEKFMKDLK